MSQLSSADTETAEAPAIDEVRNDVLAAFSARLGDGIVGSHIQPGHDLWIRVSRDSWVATAEAAKQLGYTFFDFLSAIDWMPSPFGRDMDAQEDIVVSGAQAKEPQPMMQGYAGGETRFQVLARLYSINAKMGVTFKADIPDSDLSIATWSNTFAGANWHEREAKEMFGINFVGHPNLINMYLPTDFQGHPLRKDFPLLARRVRPWPGIVDVEPMPGVGDDEEGEGE